MDRSNWKLFSALLLAVLAGALAPPAPAAAPQHHVQVPGFYRMNGSPDFPQCGFSARVVNALRACGAEFTHVDVLEDPELRQTLKSYSNWPTIPQLYIAGTLAGGCDIAMEMYRSGELSLAVKQAGVMLTESG